MQIRSMIKEDCPQVAAIEAVNFSIPWSQTSFLEAVEKENYCYLVAEEQGEILGYCGFLSVLEEAEIPNVCVKKEARKQGIASQLLKQLLQEAKQRGITLLYLEVRKSNQAARNLYESLGFSVLGIRKNFYERPVEDAIQMKKELEL